MRLLRQLLLPSLLLLSACQADGQSRRGAPGPQRPLTFAVVGDNRGESDGTQHPAFHELIKAMNAASPDLVLNTGDLINGFEGDDEAALRRMWGGYKDAIKKLKAPIYNTPGNHDIFDRTSAALWKEMWGHTYYAFEHGDSLFISLDTESESNRLGAAQYSWLEGQLKNLRKRNVFVFLHKPLFPVDGHVGSSLDVYPEERDRLHNLFVRHRDAIKGIFQGHEHLYSYEERDGLTYYITGGGGAELYAPPELGGFYHFILVRVEPAGGVSVEVKKLGPSPVKTVAAKAVAPDTLLEDWESEHPLFWYAWKQPVIRELDALHATEGMQGLRLWLDFSLSEWGVLYTQLPPELDVGGYESLSWDVFVPDNLGGRVSAVLSLDEKYKADPVLLKGGWNKVRTALSTMNIPREARAGARQLQWTLTATEESLSGWVVFDNIRAHAGKGMPRAASGAGGRLLEGWEGDLLWGAWDESVSHEALEGTTSQGARALKISFDFTKYKRPVVFASLRHPWDLSRVSELTADIYASTPVGSSLRISLGLSSGGKRYVAPAASVRPGWNRVAVKLDNAWLPEGARRSVGQVEWHLSSDDDKLSSWVAFDNLRAGSVPMIPREVRPPSKASPTARPNP